MEWSSWSDCYIVSNGKERFNALSSEKLHETFSECGIQKLSGRQYRTSRCLDNGFMEECIAAGKEHQRQTRKCTPSCKQSLWKSKPPKYLYDKSFDNNNAETKKYHQRQLEDYEVITNGDVEEVKRRSKKTPFKQVELKQDADFDRSNRLINTEEQKAAKKSNDLVQFNRKQKVKMVDESDDNFINVSLSNMRSISERLKSRNNIHSLSCKNLSDILI